MKTLFESWRRHLGEDGPSSVFYHGTTAKKGKMIERDGELKPGQSGNWASGPLGGNPSNPDLVYVTRDKDTAIGYMHEIMLRAKVDSGALVTVEVSDYRHFVPDEDVIEELLFAEGPLSDKIWNVYLSMLAKESPELPRPTRDAMIDYLSNGSMNDDTYAEIMKDIAEALRPHLTPADVAVLARNTMAFSVPLRVVNVEYMMSQ